MSKTIAQAFPNRRYQFFSSIASVRLEARVSNGRVYFYSIENDTEVRLKEQTIRDLFPVDASIKRRPFNYKDNHKFWVVINRKKKKYQSEYEELVNQ
jgi:hypothetical protein